MAAGRHLGFDVTRNSAILSVDPENPTLEPNMHRLTRCGDIRVSWGIWNPILGKGEVVGGQRWHHSKERWWFPIQLSIVTVVLSVTIRQQFAIECLRRSNQQEGGHFGLQFPGVLLGVGLYP